MEDKPHRPDVEIIPPGEAPRRDPRWQQGARDKDMRVFMWSSGPDGARFRYGRPGPLGLFLVFLGLAALSGLGLLVFLGIAALTLPLIGLLVLGAVLAGLLRRL